MDIDGQRRSDNFEDRGGSSSGRGPRRGGGNATRLLMFAAQRMGIKGLLVAGVGLGAVYVLAPEPVRALVFGASTGSSAQVSGSVCEASAAYGQACDFSRAVLASTEDVWSGHFSRSALPDYGATPTRYEDPVLVVFSGHVATGGCGSASSASGPFYCPADHKLYIDPGFYDVMTQRLRAPGDFAQAFIIAHEVGHHVQNLIGAMRLQLRGETDAQTSVRVELQADCLAGVWGHTARGSLDITPEDLSEAMRAAHQIGDDALGHRDQATFTHGSSEQRMRWFKRGFDSGDPGRCDTFAVQDRAAL